MVGAAAAGAAPSWTCQRSKRLLFGIFHEDVTLFKEYCLQDEEDSAGFVEFMDDQEGAGWEFPCPANGWQDGRWGPAEELQDPGRSQEGRACQMDGAPLAALEFCCLQ